MDQPKFYAAFNVNGTSHGQKPLFTYDPERGVWIINLRPKGPGQVIFKIDNETAREFCEVYQRHSRSVKSVERT